MALITSFVVYGKSQPGGSKRGMPIYVGSGAAKRPLMKNGKPIVRVIDANAKASDWKKQVAQVARQLYGGELIDGPIKLHLIFVSPRPKNHYRSGKNSHLLKDDAPIAPIGRPDCLKLSRLVEDSLTGVVWTDDSRIVTERLDKRYGAISCCIVKVETIAANQLTDWTLDMINEREALRSLSVS